jgi:Mg-chelatase subunit ChlD
MNAFSAPSNEPPPAYTPGPGGQAPVQPAAQVTDSGDDDDPYSFLRSFDTAFLIDDSGSMAGRSWKETAKALEAITPICTQRDADGIDIYFLNHPDSSLYKNVTSAGTVVEIFQTVRPRGGTPTGQRLNNILRPYLRKYEQDPDNTKPINIIIITDGEPSDDVESPIIAAARKLDKLEAPSWQVGIQVRLFILPFMESCC